MSVSIRTSQNVVLEYEPASIGDRILATLLDYLVFLGWVLLAFAVPAGLGMRIGTFYGVIGALPIFFYDLLCEYFLNGRSVGKLAIGTRVVMLDGSQPGLGRIFTTVGAAHRRISAFFLGDNPHHHRGGQR